MFNLKKGQVARKQKQEERRIIAIVRDQILPILYAECGSFRELQHRVDGVGNAFQSNIQERVVKFRVELQNKKFGELEVKALEGKGDKTEQKIIDLLKDESLKTVDEIFTRLPEVLKVVVNKDMMNRKADSLNIEL